MNEYHINVFYSDDDGGISADNSYDVTAVFDSATQAFRFSSGSQPTGHVAVALADLGGGFVLTAGGTVDNSSSNYATDSSVFDIATLSWQAQRHVSFTSDPFRATVRVQISDSAEAADFTVIDDIDNAEAGACAAGTAAELVAISTRPSEQEPVIYLSANGPADYRIYVQSKSFSVRDAAALIVGAHGARHRLEAASL